MSDLSASPTTPPTEPYEAPPVEPDSVTPPEPDRTPPARRLRRSRKNRVLAGVCGGLARYLDVDPVVIRVLMVALIFAGVGVLAYIVAWIVIPETADDEPAEPADRESRERTVFVLGIGLIGLGVLLMARMMVPWFHNGLFWPLVVVAGGIVLIATARR